VHAWAVGALGLATVASALPRGGAAQIPVEEYAARREALAAAVGDGVVVAFGAPTPVTDRGPFFQLPAFHYLTGFDEPDAAMVMVVSQGRGETTLFLTPIDPRTALYYGRRPDSANVRAGLGVAGRSFAAIEAVMDSLARSTGTFWSLADFQAADFAREDSLTLGRSFMQRFADRHDGVEVRDAHPLVDGLRARKSAAEIALLKEAAGISSEGHRAAMLVADPRHEYELRAAIEGTFTRLGAERVAYGSIVGAGANGTQLHYMKDMAPARAGDLVVIDAGAEYRGYAADITRTIPVSGTYTAEQRRIYQLVRDAQAAAERNSGPGLSQPAAHDSSFAVRARGLAELGLVEGPEATFDPPWRVDCEARPDQCRQATLWTIHGISHGIGLEVHDPAQYYGGDRTYQPGDVFTIEPGVYISSASLDILPDTPRNRRFIAAVRDQVARYENTGVRIEDDYVITPTGLERISTAPREIDEIEALMRRRVPIG
jgi:Xaa-Pro aminopeptidase